MTRSGETPIPRVGGRVLILDPDDRVLLIHERIEGGVTHWLTPGGGLEADETPAQAAVRETVEEVGLRVDLTTRDALLVTRRTWSWDGRIYDQVDHFFAARVGSNPPIQPQGLTLMERSTVLGHAWWTIDELRTTREALVPPDLGEVLEQVLVEGVGSGPADG